MFKKTLGFVITLFVFFSISTYAQGNFGLVGKVFDKKEANILYGQVKKAYDLKPGLLKQALLKAKDYVVFVVKNGRITLANEKKQVLAGEVQSITQAETQYFFSKEKIAEFVSLIGDAPISLEERSETLTLTADNYTLEMSLPCPPICWPEK